ncbi:hypothetical protein NIES267_54910 [Calothrix parasitica NIES-267]|uniref:Uncharacterized protein n=1 Tax=Calothrix parasitica NIES-267 TaxID=1973488 RepID=A0A1Z4LXJ9_9CYAN|nr:hypothetical protein NIES267_54910 [Calothrix parasitica NIES-267]
MDNININNLVAIIGLIITILTALTGMIIYYVNAEKRKYGLERDFAHIKGNYEQINRNLHSILVEIDHRFDVIDRTLIEIKSKINNK